MNIKKKIRHAIRWFMPYGMVLKYQHRHTKENVDLETQKSFVLGFRNYINNKERVKFIEQSPFKTIVSVQGFGYSGSGAIVDLLREYESTIVVGNIDKEGSIASENLRSAEVDILRLAGGLFEVEKFLGSNNIFQNDALLHRVMAQIEYSELYKQVPSTRRHFYEYMDRICEVLTNSPHSQYYNPYLYHGGNNDIYYLRNISVEEYRQICRELLYTLFAILKGESKATVLVLDQFVTDWELDIKRYLEYVPNLKLITSHRDLRDIYVFANLKDVEWIPHHTVDAFIKCNKILYKKYNSKETESYLAVQFEQLIEEYDKIVPIIEKYVELNSSEHTYKGTCLNPNVSRENMYLWKADKTNQEIYDEIKKSIPQLCYSN